MYRLNEKLLNIRWTNSEIEVYIVYFQKQCSDSEKDEMK